MLDELAIIDIFEKLKTALLAAAPSLEHELLSIRERTWRGKPHEFFREKLVATLLEVDLTAAAGRRQVRRLLKSLEPGESLAQSLESLLDVAEAKARSLRVADITQKNIHDLRDALGRLDHLAEAPGDGGLAARIEAQGNPAHVVDMLASAIPQLRGMKVYHFLQQSEYPIVVPDVMRQRFLYRLGLWPEIGQTRALLLGFQDLCGTIARLTGEPAGGIDLLTGLYSGAITRRKLFAPVCLHKPLCEECPVRRQCSYYRYRGSAPEPEKSNMRQMKRENRPREKFERLGPDQATDAELVAILLRTGAAGRSALEVSSNLLRVFETIEGVEAASVSELTAIKGIGRSKAVEIKAALELGKRLFTRPLSRGVKITCSSDVFNAFHMRFRMAAQEEFMLLCLSTKNQVLKEVSVSLGSLNQSSVHPREVFKEAIRESAHAVLFIHNHPSGDPRPSESDLALTRQLKDAGEMLKIKVLDHIIVGDQSYYSFADHKML